MQNTFNNIFGGQQETQTDADVTPDVQPDEEVINHADVHEHADDPENAPIIAEEMHELEDVIDDVLRQVEPEGPPSEEERPCDCEGANQNTNSTMPAGPTNTTMPNLDDFNSNFTMPENGPSNSTIPVNENFNPPLEAAENDADNEDTRPLEPAQEEKGTQKEDGESNDEDWESFDEDWESFDEDWESYDEDWETEEEDWETEEETSKGAGKKANKRNKAE